MSLLFILSGLMAAYLVWTAIDARTQPTQVASRLLGKAIPAGTGVFRYRFLWFSMEYTVETDSNNRIVRIFHPTGRTYTESSRQYMAHSSLMKPPAAVDLMRSGKWKRNSFGKLPIVNIWFCKISREVAYYNFESSGFRQYIAVESKEWSDSIFKECGLDGLLKELGILGLFRQSVQLGRQIGRHRK